MIDLITESYNKFGGSPNAEGGVCRNMFGAGDRVRTGDIQLGRLTLYQLSYSRIAAKIVFLFCFFRWFLLLDHVVGIECD